MEDPSYGVSWEPVNTKGHNPGKLSHHRPAVFGHSVVIFGGINDYDNTPDAYEFDSTKYQWTKLKQTGNVPKPRDDHSLSQINENSFLIFGGFVQGSRVNECYTCKKNGNTLEWTKIEVKSEEAPCIRASHSSSVYNDKCYIFGGQDDDNNKLNDLWELDLATGIYKEIKVPEGSVTPVARSGHSSNIYNGQMYIFGGILELTKELNEMLIFDFKTGKFSVSGGDNALDDIQGPGASHARRLEDTTGGESPGLKLKTQKTMGANAHGHAQSPTKVGTYGSPSKLASKSPTKTMKSTKKINKSPKKHKGGEDA